jgi:hypothetical protein
MNKGRLVKKTELYRELKQALEFKKFSEMEEIGYERRKVKENRNKKRLDIAHI